MTSSPEAMAALRASDKFQKDRFHLYYLFFLFLLRTGSPQLTFSSRRKTSGIQRLIAKCLIGTLGAAMPKLLTPPPFWHMGMLY